MATLLKIISISIMPKMASSEIGYKLYHREFRCKCAHSTCHITMISPRLVSAWGILRARWGVPLRINSGFRCQVHNKEINGREHSRHTMGAAVDISTRDLTEKEKEELTRLAKESFDVVIIYDTFIHCHVEPDKGGLCSNH